MRYNLSVFLTNMLVVNGIVDVLGSSSPSMSTLKPRGTIARKYL